MPYISSEEVKQIRYNLKKALPDFKLSVTKEDHSGIRVAIMAGKLDLTGVEQVNHYHYEKHFENNPEFLAVLKTIMNIINGSKEQKTIADDADYGAIPNFYINISVGKWDKPYQKEAV